MRETKKKVIEKGCSKEERKIESKKKNNDMEGKEKKIC